MLQQSGIAQSSAVAASQNSSMEFTGGERLPTEKQVNTRMTWVSSVIASLSPSELQHLDWCPVVNRGSKRWAEQLFGEWRQHVIWAQLVNQLFQLINQIVQIEPQLRKVLRG